VNAPTARLILGDALETLRTLPEESAQCCVTSPPYWGLRDYGVAGQLGLEKTPDEYVDALVAAFREVRRVLKPNGTLWLNLGDSFVSGGGTGHQGKHGQRFNRTHTQRSILGATARASGLKPKDLVGIPWRVAFALQADGWWLRSDIIWAKPNPMPESVTDRPTKAHEYLFLLAKSERYFYDAGAIAEAAVSEAPSGNGFAGRQGGAAYLPTSGGIGTVEQWQPGGKRNRRTVWTITSEPFPGAHFAVMPSELVRPCVRAGSRRGDTVLDPFAGSGTTGEVALEENRHFLGIELNPATARWRKSGWTTWTHSFAGQATGDA
jgi:DNA modification methylase